MDRPVLEFPRAQALPGHAMTRGSASEKQEFTGQLRTPQLPSRKRNFLLRGGASGQWVPRGTLGTRFELGAKRMEWTNH